VGRAPPDAGCANDSLQDVRGKRLTDETTNSKEVRGHA